MLLTGFDAPVEQVLYLDRSMREAELLQAVARVNRPAGGKKCGYVIDYVGVTNHLTQALKAYSAEDVQGALKDLRTEIGHLDRSCAASGCCSLGTASRRDPARTQWRTVSRCSKTVSSGTGSRST